MTVPTAPPLTRSRAVGLVTALVAFLAPLLLDVPGLDAPGERMLAIFALAIVLFVTEAIPLVATAVVQRLRLDPLPHLAALDPVRAMELVRRRSE